MEAPYNHLALRPNHQKASRFILQVTSNSTRITEVIPTVASWFPSPCPVAMGTGTSSGRALRC